MLDEHGNDWFNAMIDYHISQGYGKQKCLSGYDGYIKYLEERRNRELSILQSIKIDSYIVS